MITRIAWPAALALLLAIALMMCVSGCGPSSTELLPPNKALNSQMSAELAATLAELESLPCPEGAAAGTFASVKSRLREYLLENTSVKETRKAPDDDRPLGWNCGFDFYWEDDGTARGRLTWTYRNRGDYNQDGIVSIADCTPIAVHDGCTSGPRSSPASRPGCGGPGEDLRGGRNRRHSGDLTPACGRTSSGALPAA